MPRAIIHSVLLQNIQATCHPAFADKLSKSSESRVLKDGLVTTSKGPGTAIEFALSLVEQLYGKHKAEEVAEGLVRELLFASIVGVSRVLVLSFFVLENGLGLFTPGSIAFQVLRPENSSESSVKEYNAHSWSAGNSGKPPRVRVPYLAREPVHVCAQL